MDLEVIQRSSTLRGSRYIPRLDFEKENRKKGPRISLTTCPYIKGHRFLQTIALRSLGSRKLQPHPNRLGIPQTDISGCTS
jgi:hypothetical protein